PSAAPRPAGPSGAAAPPRPPAPPPAPSPASSSSALAAASTLFTGDVKVISDRPSNSLLVLASAQDLLQLRSIIRRVDGARRQVLIEARILEVSLDHTRDLGVSFHGGDASGSGNVIFGGSNAAATLGAATAEGQAALLGSMARGLAVGVLGQPF